MIRIDEIAKFVNGKVIGDGSAEIGDMASWPFAKKGDLTFALSKEDLDSAAKSAASCVLTSSDAGTYPKTVISVGDMKTAMTMLYNVMMEVKPPEKGEIHPSAAIDKTVKLGKNVAVGPNAVIEKDISIGDDSVIGANCVIGKGTTIGRRVRIYPNVTVYEYTVIKDRVVIHSGVVIGADGFGYIPRDGKIYKVPQLGNVIIEEDVEIGSNVSIDRGTFTSTVIGSGTKLDNLVQIAHNCKLGKNVLIAGQSGIAGSAVIGDNVMMGGNAGVADHANVGKNAVIGPKSAVRGTVEEGTTIIGYPAREAKEFAQLHALQSLILKKAKTLRKILRDNEQ